MQTLTVKDFKPGMKVLYVPAHAKGNVRHPDCEWGIVSSVNDTFVFVRYARNSGGYRQQGIATRPEDLLIRED